MKFKQVDAIPERSDRYSYYQSFIEDFLAANIKMAIISDIGDKPQSKISALRSASRHYDNVEIVKRGSSCFLRRKY